MTSPSGQPRPVRAPAGSQAFLDIVNAAVPPRPRHDHTRPMCAAWDDHRHWSRCCLRGFETMGNQHDQTCINAPNLGELRLNPEGSVCFWNGEHWIKVDPAVSTQARLPESTAFYSPDPVGRRR